MTLTEMLNERESTSIFGDVIQIGEAKEVFKEWLKTVSLGGVEDYNIADDTRNQIIILVDES